MEADTVPRVAARIGIDGFGRAGRLALRAGWDRDDLEFVHVDELHGYANRMVELAGKVAALL